MTVRAHTICVLASSILLLTVTRAGGAVPALRGIAVEEGLDSIPLPADVAPALPMIVRLTLDAGAFTGDRADASVTALQARLDAYHVRNIPVIIALGTLPVTDAAVEPWRQFIRAVAERGRGKVAAYQVGDYDGTAEPDVNRYVYVLKLAAVQLRSLDPDALVIEGTIPAAALDWQQRVFAAGAGPYVDGVAVSDGSAERMVALIEREHQTALIIQGPIRLPGDASGAALRLVDTELRALGTRIQVHAYVGDVAVLKAALTAAARAADLIAGNVVTLDEGPADLQVTSGPSSALGRVPHRLVYSLTGLATYLVYWPPPDASEIDVAITLPNVTVPMVRDVLAGAVLKPLRIETEGQGKRLHLTLPAAGHPLVLDFNFGVGATYVQTSDVQQDTLPRVEEIIFRHQQVQAAQDGVLQHYVAHVRMEQHFHPSAADAAYNLITENRLFSDRGGVEWEELSFELNGAKWTGNRPAFPLVQPEKVLSLPLDLHLNQDYAYRLDGVDTVNGRSAFAVRFDPVDARRALYRGTVWIDRKTYVRLKIQAVQTKFSGPVVSNDETQVFEPAGEVDGRTIWLLGRLSSKQVFLIAGRSVLVERDVRLSDVALNTAGFDAERAASRASNRIMYRDTDEGVRFFVKKGETRVVSNQMTTSAKAFVLGADIDPSFEVPLPIGGINILDFNFLNRDMQLALLYGGVIALGNIQRANLFGGKFDASVDFFGLALKANDDVFDGEGRRATERVNRIPAATGLNLGYQITPFHKVTAHYEFKYDAYFRDAVTGSSFVIPSSTATNGEGIGYEYRRRGYSLAANVIAYQRAKWTEWSDANGFDAADRTFSKYDVGLSKDFIFATFHTIHLNGTYFGGQRLDRFSAYQFGLFDSTRMHGVPASVRFGELGMFRGSYSFNLFDQYRLDLFFDRASGRDPHGDNLWRQVTGTGIKVNFRTPMNTILQIDYGKSFLPASYRGAGSNVLQIMLLKPL